MGVTLTDGDLARIEAHRALLDETLHDHYHILEYFEFDNMPRRLQIIAAMFCDVACTVAENCEGLEAAAALSKLLEAKDAAVRAVK